MTIVQVGASAPAPAAGPNDQGLADKLDKANLPPAGSAHAEPAEKPQRPEWVPEKFWDAEKGEVKTEALAKSYGELEKMKGAKPTEAAPSAQPSTEEAKTVVEAAGLSFEAMSAEFATAGDLSPETRGKLEAAGFTKDVVDTYLAGIKATGETLVSAAYEGAGDKAGFEAMQAWAVANATDADLKAYNELVASPDPAKVKLAVQGLYAKYTQAEGTPAQRRIEGDGGNDSGDVYESYAQVTADMKKPEYKKDPAFRAKVAEKLGRSKAL